ncbi:MAG: type II toxin-antitoxin system RelE/ParE family toxin [Actinomycetia bacterium]|nr:type II toxin-antitoxin system RelE/ParE family toxin [Actinomycetes bacterium]
MPNKIPDDAAAKVISKMDPYDRRLVLSWIDKNLDGCENPRQHGSGLVGTRSGEWRYRIGTYREIAEIRDEDILILVLTIGHR